MTKWQANGNIFSEKTWNRIFELSFKVTQETKLRWLQFQTLHRIVPTNEYLFKLNILNSSSCIFGKNYIETVEHLFYDCVHVKELWVKIEEWMLNKFNISVCFDKICLVWKIYNIYRLQNLLILSVKQYIFASKYKQTTTPSLYVGCLEKTIIDMYVVYRKIFTTERL